MDNKRVPVNQIPSQLAASQAALAALPKSKPWYRKATTVAVLVGVVVALAGAIWALDVFLPTGFDSDAKPVISTQPLPTTDPHSFSSTNQPTSLEPAPDPVEVAPFRFNPRQP